MSCNPKYIEKLKVDGETKQYLRETHRKIFDQIVNEKTLNNKEKLFKKYTYEGSESYYYPPKLGDPNRLKAFRVIKQLNDHFGAKVVDTAFTKASNKEFVFVNVSPLASNFLGARSHMNNDLANNITVHGDSFVTSLPSSGLTANTVMPMFDSGISYGKYPTPMTGLSSHTATGNSFQGFTRGAEINTKYPQADKLMEDLSVKMKIVDPQDLVKDGERVKALMDPWTNTIKAAKDATPETIMHEILHAVLFKATDTRSEEKFRKSAFGRDLNKFTDSLRNANMPENEVVDNVLSAVSSGSVQEVATYGLLNYSFTRALNEVVSPNQKITASIFSDMAKSTLKGIAVRPSTKLAELINIIDKHTTSKGVVEQPIENIAPEVTEAIARKFENFKSIGSGVKMVRGEYEEISFEKDGHVIKYSTGENKLGFTTPIAREYEVKIRKTIENILDGYIDKDGKLKEKPDDIKQILPEKQHQLMEDVLSERLKEYPVGTRFIHDQNLYAEAWNKAGRLDFLALKPNGKADLLSFDLISNAQYGAVNKDSPMRDIKPQRQLQIREHLNQLKGILKTVYDIKDFDQIRSIPLFADTRKVDTDTKKMIPGDMSWDGLNTNNTNKKTIDAVPTWDESTGNKDLDTLIKKLVLLHEAKGGDKYSEANANAKKDIARTIRAVQLGKGILVLANTIDSVAKSSEYTVLDFERNMKFKDVDKLTIAQMAEQARKLNKSSKELELYSKIYNYYKNVYPDPTKKEQEHLARLEATSKRAGEALFKLEGARREFIQDKIATKYGIEDLLMPEKRVGVYEGYTNTFSNPVTKAQYVFQRMLRNTRSAYEVNIQSDLDKLNVIYHDIQGWLKGRSNKDLLDLIKRKDEHGNRVNELVGEYQRAFYVTAKKKSEEANSPDKKVQQAAIQWFKENTEQEDLKKWAAKSRAKELAKLDQFIDPGSFWYQDRVNQINAKYDVNGPGLYKIYNAVKQFPKKSIWHSEEFKALTKEENKPIYELYKFAKEVNKRASDLGYIEAEMTSRFLPFIHKSLTEKFVLGGSWSLTDSILDGITVSRTDTDYGTWDRLSNEPIDHLVKYFTGDFGVEKVDASGKKYIDHSNVSDDIVKNLALYAGKVREYEGKSEIEDIVKTLLWAEKNKESLQTNMYGNVVEDAEPFTNNDNNYGILKDFIQNQFYDQHLIKSKYTDAASESFTSTLNKTAAGINKLFGREVIPESNEERRFSMMKTLQAAQSLQGLKVLSLNFGASTYRFIGTTVQGWIESGEYYTTSEFFKNEVKHGMLQFYKGDAQLHLALMKSFWPVDSQRKREIAHLSLSNVTAESLSDRMMRMIESAHDYVQYVNYGAMMDNAVLIDGKIHNARKYVKKQNAKERYTGDRSKRKEVEAKFEEDVAKLIEEHGLVKKATIKDGKLVIDGLDMKSESVAIFKDMVRNTGRKLSGNISPENESRLRMTVLGRQLLMFKNWLPGMIHTRFVSLSHNEGFQEYEWGRMRMCIKLIGKYTLRSLDKMISMYRATDSGIDMMTALYEEKKAQAEKNKQPFNLTKEEFFDLMRQNFAKQAKEVVSMIGIFALATMMMGFAHDHKDDESRGFYAFAARTMHRSFEEVNLYYNPVSLNAIINGSLFPTLGLLTDMSRFVGNFVEYSTGEIIGDEEMIKNAHPLKYGLKSVPGLAQIPNFLAILAPDMAKELGITVNAQQVKH